MWLLAAVMTAPTAFGKISMNCQAFHKSMLDFFLTQGLRIKRLKSGMHTEITNMSET
jgi:hypothetical protein